MKVEDSRPPCMMSVSCPIAGDHDWTYWTDSLDQMSLAQSSYESGL